MYQSESSEEVLKEIARALLDKHAKTFVGEFSLFVRREILVARIEVMQQYGTFPHAMVLQRELDQVNWQIAKRAENP